MPKTQVIYATMTGHSRKYAQAIAKARNVVPEDVKTDPRAVNVDTLFVVGGIYGGAESKKLVSYLQGDHVKNVKKAVLVTSSTRGAARQAKAREVLEAKGVSVVDEKLLPGSFLFLNRGRPNEADLKAAADYARKIK
ncbi:MAG: hypothetical protein LBQ15_10535 [Clostridium sp.]|jgi:flavodoxin|nr:hypothetical protein [Clostridium sp.]